MPLPGDTGNSLFLKAEADWCDFDLNFDEQRDTSGVTVHRYLSSVRELVDLRGGNAGDDQTRRHDGDAGQDFVPHGCSAADPQIKGV